MTAPPVPRRLSKSHGRALGGIIFLMGRQAGRLTFHKAKLSRGLRARKRVARPNASGERGRGAWTKRQGERGACVARLTRGRAPPLSEEVDCSALESVGRGAKHGAKRRRRSGVASAGCGALTFRNSRGVIVALVTAAPRARDTTNAAHTPRARGRRRREASAAVGGYARELNEAAMMAGRRVDTRGT